MSFEDLEEGSQLWRTDGFAAVRALINVFNDQMKSALLASEYFSIDETLYALHHQIGFTQYNPGKPAKYGLLYQSLNDAQFPFTYQVMYCRKVVDGNGPYHLNITEDYGKYLVESMPEISMKGRNMSIDRLYTSISTSNRLLH